MIMESNSDESTPREPRDFHYESNSTSMSMVRDSIRTGRLSAIRLYFPTADEDAFKNNFESVWNIIKEMKLNGDAFISGSARVEQITKLLEAKVHVEKQEKPMKRRRKI